MIQVSNLMKSFRDLRRGLVHAVDHVSFEARPGEIFGLLGPNGAGKTTTMRILCTVLKPTGGTARVAGYDVATEASLVRQHIGFMSANTAIYDRMSAWEMVTYFGRLYGMDEETLAQRLDTVFTTLQMNDFRDMLGSKMSTGMRRKSRSPGRSSTIRRCSFSTNRRPASTFWWPARCCKTSTICALGKCILFSTHIMREVERLCDRVAIVSKGKIQACGTLTQLRGEYGQQDLEELFFQLVS